MKNIWTVVLAFLLGAGAGALAADRMLRKRYEDIADCEIASMSEYYHNKFDSIPSPEPSEPEAPKTPEVVRENPSGIMTRSTLDGTLTNEYQKSKRNYHLLSTEPEQVEPSEPPEDEENPIEEVATHDGPYIISDEDYLKGGQANDKISLYYYKMDDILCDENEDIVDDPRLLIGSEAMNLLKNQTTVWIRNDQIGVDYEVIGTRQRYAEVNVARIKEEALEPPPKPKSAPKRKPKNEE